MKRNCLIIICLLFLFNGMNQGSAFGDEVDHLYDKAAEKYYELFRNHNFSQKTENWLTTIKQFKLIYTAFPNHSQAPKSLFNIGKLYRALYQLNKREIYLDRSNIAFRTMVSKYPNSDLSDDAQYLLGENYELFKKDNDLAQEEYKRALELYPKGSSAGKVKEKLEKYESEQRIALETTAEVSVIPDDLTLPQFGGLSEEESSQHPAQGVSKVDYWSTPDWSRMVINVKGEVRYKYQLLKKDRKHRYQRLYIDLFNTFIPPGFKKNIAADDGLITQARVAQFDESTVRIVLDIVSLDRVKIFHFSLPNQYKIVVDMLGKSEITTATQKPQKPTTEEKQKKPDDSQQAVTLSKALGLKVNTIVIDPGHGGKDPGAMGFKLKEKDIALDIALRLRNLIKKKNGSVRILMTRSTDKYVELEARTAFANQMKGDLFVSIHINASVKEKLNGIETYYLNLTTDNEALELAAKENKTNMKSISALQTILNDLMVNSKINESRDLAEVIHESLVSAMEKSQRKMVNLGVKKAPFAVLIGAQMPSVLVEAGFISNKEENTYLKSKSYRQFIAQGIYNGIMAYMN